MKRTLLVLLLAFCLLLAAGCAEGSASPSPSGLSTTEETDDFHDHVPYEAMLHLEVMDGKFRFQRIATTPRIVYSTSPITDMTEGKVYDGRHDVLTAVFKATDGKDALTEEPQVSFSHFIYMYDAEREDVPWHYGFAIGDGGEVVITNNGEFLCAVKISGEEMRSILNAFQ